MGTRRTWSVWWVAHWMLGAWAAAMWMGASAEEPGAPAKAPVHVAGSLAPAGDTTTAVAAAVVGIPSLSAPALLRIVIDRPFALVIRHVETGTLVLLGLSNDPR